MENNAKNTEFLQSEEWREFQAKAGSRVFCVENEEFSASIIEHQLPIVGKYFYVPRGIVLSAKAERISNFESQISNEFPMTNNRISNELKIQNSKFKIYFSELMELAKKNNIGWVRVDLKDKNDLNLIKENIDCKLIKAPHDMQPKEILVINITKPEEELLAKMSQKTRYNIKIAQKRGISLRTANKYENTNDISEFIRLVKATAKRKGISFHAENYYMKMFETIPGEILKLYCAEYQGKIIAANLVVFYGDTATYLHGATDDEYRNVMAPHLLQWQAIQDAKKAGYKKYDFGGVKIQETRNKKQETNSWTGITRFKLGFSPNTKPLEFAGSYDIIVNPRVYLLYRVLQKIKELFIKIRK